MSATLDRLTDHHLQVLQSLGWQGQRVEPDRLRFQTGGIRFLLLLHEEDPEYLHVAMLHRLPERAEPDRLRRACTEASSRMKVAKAELLRGALMVSAEQIVAAADELPDRGLLADILPRLVSILIETTSRVLLHAEFAAIVTGIDLQPPTSAAPPEEA